MTSAPGACGKTGQWHAQNLLLLAERDQHVVFGLHAQPGAQRPVLASVPRRRPGEVSGGALFAIRCRYCALLLSRDCISSSGRTRTRGPMLPSLAAHSGLALPPCDHQAAPAGMGATRRLMSCCRPDRLAGHGWPYEADIYVTGSRSRPASVADRGGGNDKLRRTGAAPRAFRARQQGIP
jgi:hypothetical protein